MTDGARSVAYDGPHDILEIAGMQLGRGVSYDAPPEAIEVLEAWDAKHHGLTWNLEATTKTTKKGKEVSDSGNGTV